MKILIATLACISFTYTYSQAFDPQDAQGMNKIAVGSTIKIQKDIFTHNCDESSIEMEGGDNSCYSEKERSTAWLNLDIGQHCVLFGVTGFKLTKLPASTCTISAEPTTAGNLTTLTFTGCALDHLTCQRTYVIKSDSPLTVAEFKKNLGENFSLEMKDPATVATVSHLDNRTPSSSTTAQNVKK